MTRWPIFNSTGLRICQNVALGLGNVFPKLLTRNSLKVTGNSRFFKFGLRMFLCVVPRIPIQTAGPHMVNLVIQVDLRNSLRPSRKPFLLFPLHQRMLLELFQVHVHRVFPLEDFLDLGTSRLYQDSQEYPKGKSEGPTRKTLMFLEFSKKFKLRILEKRSPDPGLHSDKLSAPSN